MRQNIANHRVRICRSVCIGVAMALLTPTAVTAQQQQIEFNRGKAGKLMKLPLPKPTKFTTKGGKKGWKIRIPGGRPLATPAVVDGVLYVGGGFGSHEFYALNAVTGERIWTFRTGDDGPTAAVVDEGCVAYNTESCTIYVHDSQTGKVLWSKWLGDPLMSQPAIADGRLFMAYPGKDKSHHLAAFVLKTGKVLWDRKIAGDIISAPVIDSGSVFAATTDGTLYRFDAESGKPHWANKCKVTSAPRIEGGKVLISQRAVKEIQTTVKKDGKETTAKSEITLEGFNVADLKTGKLTYKQPQAAVKAAYLLDSRRNRVQYASNRLVFSNSSSNARVSAGVLYDDEFLPQSADDEQTKEEVKALKRDLAKFSNSKVSKDAPVAVTDADVADNLANRADTVSRKLKGKQREQVLKAVSELRKHASNTREAAQTVIVLEATFDGAVAEEREELLADTFVGFVTAPQAAKTADAAANLGKGTVQALWSYQGSRPCLIGSRYYCVNGGTLRGLDRKTNGVLWEDKVKGKVKSTRPMTPPAVAGGRMYLGTIDGKLRCVDPEKGKVVWEETVGGRIVFEPAVANGRVYVVTQNGTLICLETGDAKADGWPMWGGSARHNGGTTGKGNEQKRTGPVAP